MFAFGRVIPVEELTARLEAVDAAAVRSFGEQMMNVPQPCIAVVGPHSRLESYQTFANRFGAGVARAAE
jgi:predicted Zn-dependent peptidase